MTNESQIAEFYHWLNHYHGDDGSAHELVQRFVAGVNRLAIGVFRCSMWLPTSHPELRLPLNRQAALVTKIFKP